MAGQDPRRSSRARGTQSQSHHSSTTSSASGRGERTTRAFNKNGSPQKSTPSGSLSSDSPEESNTADFPARRRTRGNGDDRDKHLSHLDSTAIGNGDDDLQEEDEAVRCICGFDEYPGPPPFEEDSKQGVKDTIDIDPIFTTDVNDDTAGFFVQCDICKVWQHGACVGIMTEEASPDEYFCEQCRKDFHKIFTASNGQRYSHYLPLKRHLSRATSRAGSIVKDGTRSPREKDTRSGRKSSDTQASKRRSTMNSRGGAYDEAEALRRAIEASKEDAAPETAVVDGPQRRAKRGRSDSEEKLENPKRQRTSSESVSPPPEKERADDSDEALSNMRNGSRPKSRAGAATSRITRSEKPGDKEEGEGQRAETLNKRKGRADRRRLDDSDPSEETPVSAKPDMAEVPVMPAAAIDPVDKPSPQEEKATAAPPVAETPIPPPSAQPSPDAPSIPDVAAQPAAPLSAPRIDRRRSHKKKGRNQYTRDRDDDSPARSLSREVTKDDVNHASGRGDGHGGRQSKTKGGMSSRVNMTDMKRRAALLLEYISRTQVELAGEAAPSPADSKGDDKVNGVSPETSHHAQQDMSKAPETNQAEVLKDFKEMSCMEMMDTLTRKLVKWQQEYTA